MNEQFSKSMTIIAEELDTIRLDVTQLITVYHKASAASDLTFVKIIEDKYRNVLNELNELSDNVAKEQERLELSATEGRP